MRRFTAVMVAIGTVLLIAAPPASAGGPTSVLLVSPTSEKTASLYTSDAAYDQLQRALGQNPTADSQAPSMHGGPGTSAINVTWLIHDVQVWRVDRVFMDGPDGPWVETLSSYEGIQFDQVGILHRAVDPQLLLGLLDKLGLRGPRPVQVPVVNQLPAAQAPAEPARPMWGWLLVGVAAGVVLAVGLRPVITRLRNRSA
jgi:hypothetical protein